MKQTSLLQLAALFPLPFLFSLPASPWRFYRRFGNLLSENFLVLFVPLGCERGDCSVLNSLCIVSASEVMSFFDIISLKMKHTVWHFTRELQFWESLWPAWGEKGLGKLSLVLEGFPAGIWWKKKTYMHSLLALNLILNFFCSLVRDLSSPLGVNRVPGKGNGARIPYKPPEWSQTVWNREYKIFWYFSSSRLGSEKLDGNRDEVRKTHEHLIRIFIIFIIKWPFFTQTNANTRVKVKSQTSLMDLLFF